MIVIRRFFSIVLLLAAANCVIIAACFDVRPGYQLLLYIAAALVILLVSLFPSRVTKLIRFEYEIETAKNELNETRKESEICRTKYPILMVHGVFFRDFRYFSYWGRIPRELKKNGAEIHLGQQQSAASVRASASELAERIVQIVSETGCGKVNIVAHSKGGLDARYAVSHLGMDKYVAKLTTVNTPHRGCLFADHLLKKAPEKLASKMNGWTSGKFPLNLSHLIVRPFDGDNDGLVSVESARWGEDFRLVTVEGHRGVSHGNMIDLNRENIDGFDVREFYVDLVSELKAIGV